MADVHPGQYLNEGTFLTTLQGVDDAVHVDFSVPQQVAAGLRVGETVDVLTAGETLPIPAKIVALDARVDPTTRNAMVRARIKNGAQGRRRAHPYASRCQSARCGGRWRSRQRATQGAGRRPGLRHQTGRGRQDEGLCARGRQWGDARRRGADSGRARPRASRWPRPARSSCANGVLVAIANTPQGEQGPGRPDKPR